MGVSIRAKNLNHTILSEMQERLRDLAPALKPAAEQLRGHIIGKSFGKATNPQGVPWAPYSLRTKRKRGKRRDAKMLVDTGQLRGSITVRVVRDVILVGIGGAAALYGPAHQFGTSRAGRSRNVKIPARPFLPLDTKGRPNFAAGWAREWAERTRERLARYIATGKVGR